ncbi:MAG: hypothetical protein CFE26_23135, partial [Verrucomicrobiales bacterium VVV1]
AANGRACAHLRPTGFVSPPALAHFLITPMKPSVACSLLLLLASWSMLPAAELTVNWLDQKAPAVKAGVSFGVPFKKGVWQRADSLAVTGAAGAAVPAQTWPLAVWPDGSVKWLGVAVSGGPELVGSLQLGKGVAAVPAMPLKATQDAGGVSIDTGVLQCRVAASGDRFIESMTIDGRVVARDGQLVAMTE